MGDKNLIELVDYVDININEFDNIDVSFSEYEKKKIYKELRGTKRISYKKVVAATVIFSLTSALSTIYFFPAFAENIPVLSSMMKFLKEDKIISEEATKYVKDINQVINDNGITVEMQNVMLVDSRLKFFYTIETEKPIDDNVEINYSDLYINNEQVDIGHGVATDSNKISKDGDKEKYACSTAVDVSRINLNDDIEFKWDIKEIKSNEGSWNIKFKSNKSEISKDSKQFYPNNKTPFQYEQGYTSYEKIVISPVETAINLSWNSTDENINLNEEEYAKKLGYQKGVTSKIGEMERIANNNYFGFECSILDDNGNNLELKAFNLASVEKNKVNMCFFLSGLKETPKKLILVPMNINSENKTTCTDYTLDEINKGTITRELDNGMKVLLKGVEKTGNKMIVNYSIEGKYLVATKYNMAVKLVNAKGFVYSNEDTSFNDKKVYRYFDSKEKSAWEIDSSKDFIRDFTYETEINEGEDYLIRVVDQTSMYSFAEDKAIELKLQD